MERDAPMLTAAELMRTEVFSLSPSNPISAAVESLLRRGFSGAPVVDDENRVVGILSERDCLLVLSSAAYHAATAGTVADYMCRDVRTISPATDLFKLAFLFHENPLRRLPVVDRSGHLLGLVTRRDVMRGLDQVRRAREHPRTTPTTYVLMEERRAHTP